MPSDNPFDINSLFGVQGLVAAITGGGSGIGLMMAQALEANGATVYILGRRKETLDAAAATANGNIHPIVCDVTIKDSLMSATAAVKEKSGHIDLLVANSGISGPSQAALHSASSPEEFSQLVLESWDGEGFTETFNVNTTAVFLTVAAFLPLLAKGNEVRGGKGVGGGSSQIVAVSSVGAFNRRPMANFSYGPSKAAAVHMVKQLSTRFGGWGVRANCIAPGLYPSEMTTKAIAMFDQFRDTIPEGRPGDTQDMAGAILMLASRAGAYLNGNVLVTDGGRLGVMPSSY